MNNRFGYSLVFFGDYWDEMWRRRQQLAWRLAQLDIFNHLTYIERPLPLTSYIKYRIGQGDLDTRQRWRRRSVNRSWSMNVNDKLSVLTTYAPMPLLNNPRLFHYSERRRDQWLKNYLEKRSSAKVKFCLFMTALMR